MRQLIIARKDLNMSPGKLAAQVSHASMAFLSQIVKTGPIIEESDETITVEVVIREDVYDGWLKGIFTKTNCRSFANLSFQRRTENAEIAVM